MELTLWQRDEIKQSEQMLQNSGSELGRASFHEDVWGRGHGEVTFEENTPPKRGRGALCTAETEV